MNEIENVKPGQSFRVLGVAYTLVRDTGKVIDMPRRNNWGRPVGGTFKARKLVVQTWDYRRDDWGQPHYTGFPIGCPVSDNI